MMAATTDLTRWWLCAQSLALVCVVACVVGWIGSPAVAVGQCPLVLEEMPPEWADDATLRDVFFHDSRRGWAVGDRGVVLRTVDGGRSWNRVRVPVTASLASIFFVDERHGWIVGGYAWPLVDRTTGVVLRTRDGGDSWQAIDLQSIGRLARVGFQSPQVGWAIGDGSPTMPTGIYQTRDGGTTWTGANEGARRQWIDGAMTRDRLVAIGLPYGAEGFQPATSPHGKPAAVSGASLDPLCSVCLDAQGAGWGVGSGGMMQFTRDAGRTWGAPRNLPPAAARESLNFQAVTIAPGGDVWVAGSPGSIFFRQDATSGDWSTVSIPSTLPIEALWFADAQNGWAVGQLGTIVATHDGGATWQIQRQAASRVALLYVVAADRDWSIDWLARPAAEDGYLVVVVEVPGDAGASPEPASDQPADHLRHARIHHDARQRTADALARLGVSAYVPLAEGRSHYDSAEVVRWLVQQLRIYRPAAIVVDGGSRATAQLAADVLAARQAAGDATVVASADAVPLEPWSARAVLIAQADRDHAIQISHGQFLPRVGQLLEDFSAVSRGLVGRSIVPRDATALVQLDGPRVDSLVEALDMPGQSLPRRSMRSSPLGGLAQMKRLGGKDAELDKLVQLALESPVGFGRRALQETAQLNDNAAGTWLAELALRLAERGRQDLAAEVFATLTRAHPDHPLRPAALWWLWHYYASAESAIAAKPAEPKDAAATLGQSPAGAQTVPSMIVENGQTKLVWRPVEPQPKQDTASGSADVAASEELAGDAHPIGADVVEGSDEELLQAALADSENLNGELFGDAPSEAESQTAETEENVTLRHEFVRAQAPTRLEGTRLVGQMIWQRDPTAFESVDERFLRAWYQLRTDERETALAAMRRLAEGEPTAEGYDRAARLEVMLAQQAVTTAPDSTAGDVAPAAPTSPPRRNAPQLGSLPAIDCPLITSSRPYLDGHINETFWDEVRAAAAPMELVETADSCPTRVLVARDDEYWYFAIEARAASGAPSLAPNASSTSAADHRRDAALGDADCVEVLVDTDRDYATYFVLACDGQGRAAESCTESAGWNPRWYVAAQQTNDGWTAEAAIPLGQLTLPLEGDEVWAISVRRFQQRRVTAVWPESDALPSSAWEHLVATPHMTSRQPPSAFGYLRFVTDRQ
jgi:photosystem II stability/assembly factor-like uncharacterized protein